MPQEPSPHDTYAAGPDSQPQPGVPTGTIFEFTFTGSTIFPGTSRVITVYVPAQYVADTPACVYVGLDGLSFLAPVVFDNLIHHGEMPVTIAIGVPAGRVDSADARVDSAASPGNPRFNRSLEFDALNGDLARFLVEEILPDVERHTTCDGRAIVLSTNPDDRCAGGASTGGNRGVHPRLGEPGRVPTGLHRHRNVRRHARRGPLSGAGAQDRTQADPHLHAGRLPRRPAGLSR